MIHLHHSKKKILSEQLSKDNNRSKTLYNIAKNLTTKTKENILSSSSCNKELADSFANFVVKIINKIKSQSRHEDTYNMSTRKYNSLSNFWTIKEDELLKIIKTLDSTTCSDDPCNTKIILSLSQILIPVWNKIINQSFSEGIVLQNWKEAIILPIKNHKLDTDLTNYQPISNLTLFSKLIEKVILNQLWDYCRING